MKFLSIYLLALALNVSATGFSQTVTLNEKSITYNELFKLIHKQTGYQIFYKSDVLNSQDKINVTAANASIDRVLNEVLKDKQVQYSVINKSIVIKPIPEKIRAFEKARYLSIPESAFETVRGTVTDSEGNPLADVSVSIEGTTKGTITKVDGSFSIDVGPGESLTFSRVGYLPITVKPELGKYLNIKMEQELAAEDEVVVVGYGTQKKINLTGSVSTVSADKITNRPIMNMASALAGTAAGVNVTQSRGNPGDENVAIRIRGIGSFNNSAPLVLVDGIIADMTSLNTDDIESVSILKDAASAAIYGSRAANGVILVTTKKGRKNEAPRVTINGLFARQQAVTDLKFMSNTADWLELHNIAKLNANPTSTSPDYSPEIIKEWRAANSNPDGMFTHPTTGQTIPNWLAYPNTDWAQILFQPEYYQRYTASVTGGGKTSSYLMSLGYQNNPGTLVNTGLQRYNIRANLESKIANFITFGTQTYATKEFKQPGSTSMTYLLQAFPGQTPIYQGKYGAGEAEGTSNANNILQSAAATGGLNTTTRINTTWYANANIWKGLVAETRFNYSELIRANTNYSQNLPRYSFRESFDEPKVGIGNLDQATSSRYSYGNNSYTANFLLRYANKFGKHDVSGLAGYEQYRYRSSGFRLTVKGLLDWTTTDINSGAIMDNFGSAENKDDDALTENAVISYFGRVNYVYDNKYLFEANFRSDASSKFAPGHRTGLFPSFSAGWVVSNEPFFASIKDHVNYLKLKASYGKLGNTVGGSVLEGNYDWQQLYLKVNNVFNEQVANGLIQQTIQNLNLSWEKLTTYNFGFESRFLRNRLSLEAEAYYRNTSDILAPAIVYLTLGSIKAPLINTATMGNKGIDLNFGWNDRVGEFSYGISANLNYNTNKVTKFKGDLKYEQDPSTLDVFGSPTWRYTNLAEVSSPGGSNINDANRRRVEGHMIDEYFLRRPYSGTGSYTNADGSVNPNGGPKDGMIRTKADLEWVKAMIAAGYSFNNNTVGSGAANIWYGQIVMADVNGDGKYGNDDDKEFTGKSQTPKFNFGLNLNAAWKGVDLNMIWSGRLGAYFYINDRGANGSILANVADQLPADAWDKYYFYDAVKANTDYDNYDPATDPNAHIGAKYPRLLSAPSITPSNTLYLYNASYARLKSLQIGYTLPQRWISRAKISNLRVFMVGENLVTLKNKNFEGVDPELGGSIIVYPIAQLYSAGITLTF